MALEDYPFRVEELTASGELVRVMVYADHPIIARAAYERRSSNIRRLRLRLRNRALVLQEHLPG
jgi:hypothetical protein